MPLSLCILSPLQTRHRNQIEITIPSCCWQSWARTCGLFPLVPQSLYLETYLSQKEVCRANRHSAGHRDEGSAPSCPLWAPPPLTYRHRASPEWPDVSVFAPCVQILEQKNPKWAELHSSRLFPVSGIRSLTVLHVGSSSGEG